MATKKSYDYLLKLLLIGDSNTGKTQLLHRYAFDSFNTTFISTVGIDFRIKQIQLHGKVIKLQMWDTAGQERFHSITSSYYRGAMGVLCLYNITNEKSFDSIQKWLRDIEKNVHEDVVVMLIGNYCEMTDKRQVSKERGEQLAIAHGLKFMEVSSEANINVEEAFTTLAEDILQVYHNIPELPIEVIPQELQAQGPKAIRAYLRASTHGTRPVYRTRIMLVGQERVGKTSLMNTLLNQRYNPAQPITDGVDISNICKVDPCKASTVWTLQPSGKDERAKQMKNEYIDAMRSNVVRQLLKSDQETPGLGLRTEEISKWKKEIAYTDKVDANSYEPPVQDSKRWLSFLRPAKPVSKVDTKSYSTDLPFKILKDIKKEVEKQRLGNQAGKEEPVLEFQFWDFAGQDVYYNAHQVFLNRRAIFLLAFDISKNLNDVVEVACHDKTAQRKSRFHDFTGIEFIDFWLNSIYTYAVTSSVCDTNQKSSNTTDTDSGAVPKRSDHAVPQHQSPPILIVGTHRSDLRKKFGPEEKSKGEHSCKQQIFTNIKGKPYEEHVVRKVYCIENNPKDQLKEDKMLINALRDDISTIALNEPYMGERIPVKWLQFESTLVEHAAEKKHYITLTQAKELAAKYGIVGDDEILTILQFLHDLGTIIYFGARKHNRHMECSLKELVILDPQWLMDIFKAVITVKPNEKQEEKMYFVPACLRPSQSKESTREDAAADGTFYINFYEFLPDGILTMSLFMLQDGLRKSLE